MTRLIFILSLPRAGSTLLQRLLLADGRCESVGEHSLLLRFLGEDEVIQRQATYWEFLIETARNDLRSVCPDFDEVYRDGVREMSMRIYDRIARGKPWFVDKTPRYHLICDELIKTFPEAKFVVLWRHPLAVAASISSSFRKNQWLLNDFEVDLHAGMERLGKFCEEHGDAICQVHYEDLVSKPGDTLRKIGDYLGWERLEQVLGKELPANNQGTLGDKSGCMKYSSISAMSMDAWMSSYQNWFRRSWAKRYYAGERETQCESLGYPFPEGLAHGPSHWFEGLREWHAEWKCRRGMTKSSKSASRSRRFFRKYHYHISFK